MCNAWNHVPDCSCGFGPPYEDLHVEILKLPRPSTKRPSWVAKLSVQFPIPRAIYFWRLDRVGKTRLIRSLTNALQRIADGRFGKRKFRVLVTRVKKGSIEFYVLLVPTGVVAVYKFFKDYEALRKGVIAFRGDIERVSKRLRSLLRKVYASEEKRAREKAEGGSRMKDERKGI